MFVQVYLSKKGTVADYGMLAKEDIEEGHVLFSIPRSALLHPGTSKTKNVLKEGTFLFIRVLEQFCWFLNCFVF